MERARPALQRAGEERRRSDEPPEAVSDLRPRGREGEEKEEATVLTPSLHESPTRLLVEIGLVDLGVVLPFVRHCVFRENRAHGTHRLAGAAVDAFIGMDEVHVVCIRCIYAVNGTDI